MSRSVKLPAIERMVVGGDGQGGHGR
jgi:hypothetical protein